MKNIKLVEDWLEGKFAEGYTGLDDDMPNSYDMWLMGLEIEEWIKLISEYHEDKIEDMLDEFQAKNENLNDR